MLNSLPKIDPQLAVTIVASLLSCLIPSGYRAPLLPAGWCGLRAGEVRCLWPGRQIRPPVASSPDPDLDCSSGFKHEDRGTQQHRDTRRCSDSWPHRHRLVHSGERKTADADSGKPSAHTGGDERRGVTRRLFVRVVGAMF